MSKQVDQDIANHQVILADGISNLATGLGTAKDKATYTDWKHSSRNSDHVYLAARYREDWVSQKVCNIVPQDMTREWRTFDSDDAQEADRAFRIRDLFKEAYKWARLYGTSFLVMDIADGRPTHKPVNWNRVGPGCIRSLQVVDRTRITVVGDIDQTPMSPTFGMPETYQFVNTTTPIHKSRLIRFEGTELPIYERQRNLWYSDSTLIPLLDTIDDFHTSAKAAAQMCQEANVDVITVEGLGNILQNSKGTAAMLQRFTDWKSIKSIFGVSILDSTETFDQKKIQLSGVKDLIWEYLKIVAASVGIPATRFLSASPDGMNATGESDLVNYIEFLQGLQRSIFDERLETIDRLMSLHYSMPMEDFQYEWRCIFPESEAEKRIREKDESEMLVNLTTAGILSRESALVEAKKKGLVSEAATVGDDPNKQPLGASNA